jgi:hypothetical protein
MYKHRNNLTVCLSPCAEEPQARSACRIKILKYENSCAFCVKKSVENQFEKSKTFGRKLIIFFEKFSFPASAPGVGRVLGVSESYPPKKGV